MRTALIALLVGFANFSVAEVEITAGAPGSLSDGGKINFMVREMRMGIQNCYVLSIAT